MQKHQSVLDVLGDLGDSQASLDRASYPESLAPEQLLLKPRKTKWVKNKIMNITIAQHLKGKF